MLSLEDLLKTDTQIIVALMVLFLEERTLEGDPVLISHPEAARELNLPAFSRIEQNEADKSHGLPSIRVEDEQGHFRIKIISTIVMIIKIANHLC